MKKRDIVLDFTSLLDVIMIILFLIIAGMKQTSDNTDNGLKEKDERIAQLENEIEKVNSELELSSSDLKKEVSEKNDIKLSYDELKNEYDLLSAEKGFDEIEDNVLLETLLNKTDKLVFNCTSYSKENNSDEASVEIKIYFAENGKDPEEINMAVLKHDFRLNSEERKKKNAEMQANLFKILKDVVSDSDSDCILATIQYPYNDKNFSQTDLEIIYGALNDIETSCSKKCFTDKVKL